jgi:polar amino acid transport system substrate-binding protein
MTFSNMPAISIFSRFSLVLTLVLSFFMDSANAQKPPLAPEKPAAATESRGSYLVSVPGGGRAAPDIARILNRGELIVAMVATDTPPFFSEVNGVMVGIDIDLVNEIAAELKVPVRYERSAKTFNQVVEVVADGKADFGISKLARTLARAKMVNYTIPYMGIKHALLVNRLAFAKIAKDRPAPQVIREFNGTLGVLAGASWEEFARKNFPKAEMVRFKTWELAVEAVKQGKIVAAYRDEFEVNTVFQEDPKLTLTLRTITFNDLESSLAMPVGINDRALLGFLNEFISLRAEKPSIESIMKAMK